MSSLTNKPVNPYKAAPKVIAQPKDSSKTAPTPINTASTTGMPKAAYAGVVLRALPMLGRALPAISRGAGALAKNPTVRSGAIFEGGSQAAKGLSKAPGLTQMSPWQYFKARFPRTGKALPYVGAAGAGYALGGMGGSSPNLYEGLASGNGQGFPILAQRGGHWNNPPLFSNPYLHEIATGGLINPPTPYGVSPYLNPSLNPYVTSAPSMAQMGNFRTMAPGLQ